MVDTTARKVTTTYEEMARVAWKEEPTRALELISTLVEGHNDWHNHSLNLVASHNIVSPKAKAMLGSDLAQNIAGGTIGHRDHTGNLRLDHLETLLIEMAKKLFGANYVEIRAPSGAMANGLFIFGAMEPGDRVMAISPKCNGHHTYWYDSYAGVKGLNISEIPYYGEDIPLINMELMAQEAERIKPKWIIIGTAILLFPYPMKELSEIAQGVGAKIFYDGAHFLGLAAGGQFQNPVLEGAVAMTGSTQKTMPGPVGGLILMQDQDIAERVVRKTRHFLSNYGNNRTAALAVTLTEMLAFGKEYASAVVRNAQALARAVDAEGFKVMGKDQGFTQSHIALVDITDLSREMDVPQRLEKAGIASSQMELNYTTPAKTVLRLGSNACTRWGMGEKEMEEVARLMRRVVLDREGPTEVERDVLELTSAFTKIHYCF